MQMYSKFRPSQFDSAGLALEDRQDWLVLPCGRNRDSDCLAESNFAVALERLGGEGDDVEVHRFGHWACGWFEVVLVRPMTAAHLEADRIEAALEEYPVLNENDYSQRESDEADRTWRHGYTERARIRYIRDHRSQFEFSSFSDLLGCVRGNYFARVGSASELLS